LTLGLLGGTCGWAADAEQPPSQQGDLTRTAERVWDFSNWRVIALANGQVQLWDLSDPARPMLRDTRQVDGEVRLAAIENGELRLTVQTTKALRWRMEPTGQLVALPGELTPQACPALVAPHQPRSPSRYLGVVQAVEAGEAVIALAEGADVWLDQSIALVAGENSIDDAALSRQVLAVSRMAGRTAYAELPRGETATAGELVVATGQSPEVHRWEPAKLAYERWWVAGIAPVLPMETTVGIGVFATAGARLSGPWEGEVRVSPMYLLADGSVGPSLVTAAVRYDQDYWALGLGGGGMYGTNYSCEWTNMGAESPGPSQSRTQCQDWRPALTAEARLGSKDGLHLALRFAWDDQFPDQSALVDGTFALPLSRAADAGVQWTASHHVNRAEVFGRYALIGNRGPGTTLVQIGLGGAEVHVAGVGSLLGPQLSFALEYRY
jgi:hypothetical protein